MKKFLMWSSLVIFSQGSFAVDYLIRNQATSAVAVNQSDIRYAPDGRMVVCPRFRQPRLDSSCYTRDGVSGWVYPENLPPNNRKYVGFSVQSFAASSTTHDHYVFFWD